MIHGFASQLALTFLVCITLTPSDLVSQQQSSAGARELTALHDQDQADRSIGPQQLEKLSKEAIDSLMKVMDLRDAARRQRVRQLMAAGTAQTADDYYHAAVVLQHGSDPDDYLKAHEWTQAALARTPSHVQARYLFAASWDRYQLSQGKPQWYGTSVERQPNGDGALSPIDTTQVTDARRKSYTGWTLAERRRFVDEMNRRPR